MSLWHSRLEICHFLWINTWKRYVITCATHLFGVTLKPPYTVVVWEFLIANLKHLSLEFFCQIWTLNTLRDILGPFSVNFWQLQGRLNNSPKNVCLQKIRAFSMTLNVCILTNFDDLHMWHQNWHWYVWIVLCLFFVSLLHSPGVLFFWHLTSFWQFDIRHFDTLLKPSSFFSGQPEICLWLLWKSENTGFWSKIILNLLRQTHSVGIRSSTFITDNFLDVFLNKCNMK